MTPLASFQAQPPPPLHRTRGVEPGSAVANIQQSSLCATFSGSITDSTLKPFSLSACMKRNGYAGAVRVDHIYIYNIYIYQLISVRYLRYW